MRGIKNINCLKKKRIKTLNLKIHRIRKNTYNDVSKQRKRNILIKIPQMKNLYNKSISQPTQKPQSLATEETVRTF